MLRSESTSPTNANSVTAAPSTSDLIRESADWLLARVPEEQRTAAHVQGIRETRIEWSGNRRAVSLCFGSPHRVFIACHSAARGDEKQGWFNLAFDLHEILDLIAWCCRP